MTKLLPSLLPALALLILGTPALAANDHHGDHADDHRFRHYEGAHFGDAQSAIKALHDNTQTIAETLRHQPVTESDLESIHEISYTLENAIDELIMLKAAPQPKLDNIDEAVQALHAHSENHEEAETRAWLDKLSAAIHALDKDHAPHAHAAPDKTVFEITIKDHKFSPEEIYAPAGKKLKLLVHNQDPTPEEFESDDFRREKIIAGNGKATIFVGPLKPGKYHYYGEFNLKTANGYLFVE